MPQIIVNVVSLDSAPLPAALCCQFDGEGGSIGRDPSNTLVLPDKHRRVSRLHAAVTFPSGVPTLTNASTSLPVVIGRVTLDCGQKLPLSMGDIFEIGPYTLQVQPSTGRDPLVHQGGGVDDDLLAGLLNPVAVAVPQSVAHEAAVDPFASLFSGIGMAPPRGHEPIAQRLDDLSGFSQDPLAALGLGVKASPVAHVIPDDFNPFDQPSGVSRNSADPLANLFGGAAVPEPSLASQDDPSIDSLFATSGSSSFAGLMSTSDGCDPLALFGGSTPPQDDLMRPVRDDLAEIGGAYQPPRVVATPAYAPEPPIMGGSFGESAVLMDAFLRGANLPRNTLPQGLTPEIMFMVGSLLRSATAGAVDMLAARAATKLEVQASVTIISAQSNNPLKFLPNGDVALQQLLSKKMPGFMPADEAMRDAFDDLRAHEVGVIAGTRAALVEVLGKFDPATLGERLAAGSLLETFLPSVRKTKLWDVYLERYAQIRREAEDDFQSIFGRAFVQAYERETALMKAQTAKGRGEK